MSERFCVQYGLDQGYGQGQGDFTVLVRLIGDTKTQLMYVDRVMRRQMKILSFIEDMHVEWKRMPGPILWYTGGQEKAVGEMIVEMMRQKGQPKFPLTTLPASTLGNKYIRSLKAQDAWSAGRLLVPMQPEDGPPDLEMETFVMRVTSFQGTGNEKDDDVDALAAAVNALIDRFDSVAAKPFSFSVSTAGKSHLQRMRNRRSF